MQATLRLFVGSNNHTHKVERDLLVKTLEKYHTGFTIQPALGYWEGAREESVTVLISDDKESILNTINKLKQVLKQDAIAYQEEQPLVFV